jgi:putative transposase
LEAGRVAGGDDNASCPSHAGYRFPAGIISRAVRQYFHFSLSLRIIEKMLALRGIIVSTRSKSRKRRKDVSDHQSGS